MGYIFTESFFTLLDNYIILENHINSIFSYVLQILTYCFPIFIKYLIGYCNFYYQLGYGLIFYIYIYRRRKAKKTKNWKSFYGNSVFNWIFFNAVVFSKFLFNRNFSVYLKSKINNFFKISLFWLNNVLYTNNTLNKAKQYLFKYKNTLKLNNWTPIFKRSSYISFLTFLKRFTKRK